MARFVFHHVANELLEKRLLRDLEEVAEGGHGEALDDDLHAQVLEVPAAVLDGRVEQLLQALVHRPLPLELLAEIAAEHLHVPRLVHGLRAGVVLGIDPGDRADELGSDDQRALLAVQELRELERDLRVAKPRLLTDGQPLVGRVARQRLDEVGKDSALGIDVGVPGELRRAVPLLALRLLVEVAEAVLHAAVVPGVAGVEGGEERLELLVQAFELVDGVVDHLEDSRVVRQGSPGTG